MPSLDTYRKQAKQLVRWHADHDYSMGERVRRIERYRALTDRQVLDMKFTLALAQQIIAVEAGHKNWAALKLASAGTPKTPRAPLATSAPPVLHNVIPILLVRDVTASAAFFHHKLGFAIDFLHGAPPFYGAVSRDEVCLHLRFVHEPAFALAAAGERSLLCASIEVRNVQALYKEFKAREVEFAQKLMKQVWGGTDFHVRDPDGNAISFVTYGMPG